MTKTYAVKVQNGRVAIHDARTGGYLRVISATNVVSAQITGDLVQVTKSNGKVEIYDAATGAFQRGF
jgi:hypothetical protein